MTESKLQHFNKKDLVIERDYMFGVDHPDSGNDILDLGTESVVDAEIKLLPVLWSNYHHY